MEPPVLTPREFLVLSLLDENRYYNLAAIRDLYSHFLLCHIDTLHYLQGSESLASVIWNLLKKGYLVKATYRGCSLLLRLSPTGAKQFAHEVAL